MSNFTKRHEILNAVKKTPTFEMRPHTRSLYLRKGVFIEDENGNISFEEGNLLKEDIYAYHLMSEPMTTEQLAEIIGEEERKTYNSLMSSRSNNPGVFDYNGGVWTLLFPKEDLYFYEKDTYFIVNAKSLADEILAFIKEISANKVKMVEVQVKANNAQSEVEESKARFKSLLEASDLI